MTEGSRCATGEWPSHRQERARWFRLIYYRSRQPFFVSLFNAPITDTLFLSPHVKAHHCCNIYAKPDKIDLVKAELIKLITPTVVEESCLNYDLHEDNENSAHRMFHENWKSRDLWLVRMGQPHFQIYMTATEGSVEDFTLKEMTHCVE